MWATQLASPRLCWLLGWWIAVIHLTASISGFVLFPSSRRHCPQCSVKQHQHSQGELENFHWTPSVSWAIRLSRYLEPFAKVNVTTAGDSGCSICSICWTLIVVILFVKVKGIPTSMICAWQILLRVGGCCCILGIRYLGGSLMLQPDLEVVWLVRGH